MNLSIDAPGRRRLPILLRHAWYGLNQAFRRRLAATGLTPDQFTVLRTLLEGDPKGMTQRELTHTILSDANTVASLLERMEKAGFVARVPHERDGRARRIRVLTKGKKRFEAGREVARQLQEDLFARLPQGMADPFLEHLEQVAQVCRQLVADAPKSLNGRVRRRVIAGGQPSS